MRMLARKVMICLFVLAVLLNAAVDGSNALPSSTDSPPTHEPPTTQVHPNPGEPNWQSKSQRFYGVRHLPTSISMWVETS